jgi:gas vesicle protein
MPVGAAIAAVGVITGAIISAVSASKTADKSNKETRRAGKEAKDLAMIKRQDELSALKQQQAVTLEDLKLKKRATALQEQSFTASEQQRGFENIATTGNNQWQKALDLINGRQDTLAKVAKYWERRQ